MSTSTHEKADAAAAYALLTAIREQGPLVHCLTNIVVANFNANVLLAVGASPAMVENAEETGDFAAVAGGVLVNLGTLSRERAEATRIAASSAAAAGTPWVLDPVAVGGLAFRTTLAAELLEHRPAVIRGNASEVMGLAGAAGSSKGVDSTASPEAALDAARELAARTGGVVAVSGATDLVTDGTRVVAVPLGDPLMARVTGMGCSLGALVAAGLATGATPMDSAVGATVILTVAAEVAAPRAAGPGSFAVGIVDALYSLDAKALTARLPVR